MAGLYNAHYLKQLEAESIHIFREAMAECTNPVILYSIGKDSSVLLHLARKAFAPGPLPWPLLHVDTGFKFREMIEFRDNVVQKINAKIFIEKNESDEAKRFTADDAASDIYIYHKKTKPLLDALKKYKFDAAFGGARREEEKSRAKERVFSLRNELGSWDPKNQRPELWSLYNARMKEGESMRIFPLSNWTEADIWAYILMENIEVVPLYFAQKRSVVVRNNLYFRIDEFVQPKPGEEVIEVMCRYRTLGCSPSTGAVASQAITVEEILAEVLSATKSERQTRAIDHTSAASMEQKKKEGYF